MLRTSSSREICPRALVMAPNGAPAPAPLNFEVAFQFPHYASSQSSPFFNLRPSAPLLELTAKPKQPTPNYTVRVISESLFCLFLEQECCQGQGCNTVFL